MFKVGQVFLHVHHHIPERFHLLPYGAPLPVDRHDGVAGPHVSIDTWIQTIGREGGRDRGEKEDRERETAREREREGRERNRERGERGIERWEREG